MFLEFINQIREVGIDRVIYTMKMVFFTMYVLCITFNYAIFIEAKRSKKIAIFIFLSPLEAVYICFWVLWMGCFQGRREQHIPLLIIAELGVFLIMEKLVVRHHSKSVTQRKGVLYGHKAVGKRKNCNKKEKPIQE